MFTCTSCGYEANPDSAPACSLCGTKRAGGAPEPAAKPATASSAKGSAAGKAPKQPDGLDELAKAVADSTTMPQVSSAGARSKPQGGKGGERVAVLTTQGTLRMSQAAPPVENATMFIGSFVGTVLLYIGQWARAGHAPSAVSELILPLLGAIAGAIVARFAIAPGLEDGLSFRKKELLHGPIAGLVGGLFAIFAVFAFVQGSRDTGTKPTGGSGLVGEKGELLAEHLAFLTPGWRVELHSDKYIAFGRKEDKVTFRVPRGTLTQGDVDDIVKFSQIPQSDLVRMAGPEPLESYQAPLPKTFNPDQFLDRVSSYLGVFVDKNRRSDPRLRGIPLVRRRKGAPDEQLLLLDTMRTVNDVGTALPRGVPIWVGVGLGLSRETTAAHDEFMSEVCDQYRPPD